jgi:hypothetical protein
MESVSIKTIRTIAEAYDFQLRANDPRFRRETTLIHEDGSVVHYDSAFLMKIVDRSTFPTDKPDEVKPRYWIITFTEHHGLHIDHSDELLLYWESDRRHEEVETLGKP